MVEALLFAVAALVLVVGLRVNAALTEVRLLRAEIAKGSPLATEEAETAAQGLFRKA